MRKREQERREKFWGQRNAEMDKIEDFSQADVLQTESQGQTSNQRHRVDKAASIRCGL